MPYPLAAVRGSHAPPYLRGIAAAEEHSTTYSDIVMAAGPIAYWPLWETGGTVAEELVGGYDGTYSADVLTIGTQTGIGDGNEAVTFGRTPAYVSIVTAGLNAVWDGDEFTIIACCQYSAAVDGDGTARRVLRLNVDGNNNILISKASVAGEFAVSREANGLYKAIFWVGLSGGENWQQFAITMTAHDSRQRGYRNGAMNPTVRTVLQPWTVDPLIDAATKIGAANETPDNYWKGGLCHVALFGQELSAGTLLSLVPPGIT